MRARRQRENTLNALGVVWSEFPQLRLGQLLANILGSDEDPYYLGDGQLQQRLYRYLEEHGAKRPEADPYIDIGGEG